MPHPPEPRSSVQARLAAPLLALALAAAPAMAGPAAGGRATYRLQGTLRVDARPFPAGDQELRADAVIAPGSTPGALRVQLSGEGLSCELSARAGPGGALDFAAGQRCLAELKGGEVEGRVEARLLAGSGRATEDALELELAFSLAGVVRARAGGALEAMGALLEATGAGGREVPVRGEARGRALGRRDRSRAAGG